MSPRRRFALGFIFGAAIAVAFAIGRKTTPPTPQAPCVGGCTPGGTCK